MIFAAIVFFGPEMGGYFLEYNNFIPADSLKTPPHIAPVWYFTPFYSMLRAMTADFTLVLTGIAVISAIGSLIKGRFKSRHSAPGIACHPGGRGRIAARHRRQVLGRGRDGRLLS